MPTIKEIAKAAGVSPSTVSIVLSGKAQERSISQSTYQKVMQTVHDLDYHINVSARRLRSQTSDTTLVIAVFWALDYRTLWMVRFLRGLQEEIASCGKRIEIVIHFYNNNQLDKSLQTLGFCNAAIVCNASNSDLYYLEQISLPVPIVLYNRHSNTFCTVNVDDSSIGRIPAEVFASHGRRKAALLTSEAIYSGISVRDSQFRKVAEENGIAVECFVYPNTMRGGYLGGLEILRSTGRPDCLFCASDSLALGAMRALFQTGVAIPNDIEIISVGNGDREMEEYAMISLSVVPLPMETMAKECLQLVLDLLGGTISPPQSITLPVAFRARESTLPV